MTDTKDHPPADRGHTSPPLPASEPSHSHLAHWPPPHGHEGKSEHVKHHVVVPAERTKSCGSKLTRSSFAEDDG